MCYKVNPYSQIIVTDLMMFLQKGELFNRQPSSKIFAVEVILYNCVIHFCFKKFNTYILLALVVEGSSSTTFYEKKQIDVNNMNQVLCDVNYKIITT